MMKKATYAVIVFSLGFAPLAFAGDQSAKASESATSASASGKGVAGSVEGGLQGTERVTKKGAKTVHQKSEEVLNEVEKSTKEGGKNAEKLGDKALDKVEKTLFGKKSKKSK